jgi:hypothetical protein
MLMRVVVLAAPVMDLPAWMAALDLDGRVPDREPAAQPALQVANYMLGIAERALLEDNVGAEGHRL